MATTEKQGFVGTSSPRKEDGADHRTFTARTSTTSRCRECCGSASCGARSPTRGSTRSTSPRHASWRASSPPTRAPSSSSPRLFMAWPINADLKAPEHHPLTKDKARYVGDPVAIVVAERPRVAQDAVELVEVDWEPQPAVTGIKEALAEGAPLVHEARHERRRLVEHRGRLAGAAASTPSRRSSRTRSSSRSRRSTTSPA